MREFEGASLSLILFLESVQSQEVDINNPFFLFILTTLYISKSVKNWGR